MIRSPSSAGTERNLPGNGAARKGAPRVPVSQRARRTAPRGVVRERSICRDRLVARIWSAKEAVLEALGLGLRMDTRGIEIGDPIDPAPSSDLRPEGFAPLAVELPVAAPTLDVSFREHEAFVITVAAGRAGGSRSRCRETARRRSRPCRPASDHGVGRSVFERDRPQGTRSGGG